MRALRFDDRLHLCTNEPDPQPATDEALIHLRMAGICQTDLELTQGYKNFQGILGHEFVGELVHDAGPFAAGTRVVGEINMACGQCDLCQRGIPSQCRNRSTLGIDRYPGAFADFLRLPIRNLYAVPANIPDAMAVLTEPLAAALQVTELVPVTNSDRVVLIGAGKLGLLIAQVLKLTDCTLTVVARQNHPIDRLKAWDIPYLDSRTTDPLSLGRALADVVVDSTGNAEGFALALDLVRPRGTVVLKSTYVTLPTVNLTRVVVDEITVVGSRCGPFDKALALMSSGKVELESLIEARYSLNDAVDAFHHAAQRGVLKVILTP
jgi:threonine dehydrogenase-like Zn-dependent dehydrogenase